MNTILIHKDGRIMFKGDVVFSRPFQFLSHKVQLGEGFTLGSFLWLLENYPSLAELNPILFDYADQYKKRADKDGSRLELKFDEDHLEFSKTVELIGFPNEPRLEIYHSFNLVKKNHIEKIADYPLESLLDAPLKLGKLKHMIFGDKVDIFEFDTVYTLFELIDGISWHLGFQGASESCNLRR